jgi:shikimate kinase / 3-dehydroquinate synthase
VRNLVLTGFMGTGKTTVGRILARRYGLEFVDTDDEVERRSGCSVAELFARAGEARFRELETDVLRHALDGSGKIIATGGGTLVSPHSRLLLSPEDTAVCLTCEPEVIGQRVGDAADRPLFDPAQPHTVTTLLAERENVYSLYPMVDTTQQSPSEVADSIGHLASLQRTAVFTISPQQSSTVLFEEGLSERIGLVMAEDGLDGPAFVLTDSHVAELDFYGSALSSLQAAGFEVSTYVIAAGEEHKTLETMDEMYQAAMQAGLDRSAVIVGIGGGVVGDMAGMLAATYLRGLRLVLMPTTLLAQVDAAIGGKVGIDFRTAKNMIGAFKPAQLVVIDPRALQTLPVGVLIDGLIEVIKLGFIRSKQLVSLLQEVDPDRILDHPHLIRAAACQKVEVVQRDPLEHGERMLLNFGHTIGHGLEAASGYRLSHGRAVSIGMVAETRLAVSHGWCSRTTLDALVTMLDAFSLPTNAEEIDVETVLRFVRQDKKRRAGTIRMAIPREIGKGEVVEVTPDDVVAALKSIGKV